MINLIIRLKKMKVRKDQIINSITKIHLSSQAIIHQVGVTLKNLTNNKSQPNHIIEKIIVKLLISIFTQNKMIMLNQIQNKVHRDNLGILTSDNFNILLIKKIMKLLKSFI